MIRIFSVYMTFLITNFMVILDICTVKFIILKGTCVCPHVLSGWHSKGRGPGFPTYQGEHNCIVHSMCRKLSNTCYGGKPFCIFLHKLHCNPWTAEASLWSHLHAPQQLLKLQYQQFPHIPEQVLASQDIRGTACLQKTWPWLKYIHSEAQLKYIYIQALDNNKAKDGCMYI